MEQLNGMRTLTIENGLLEAVLLLDKGGDIIELRDKTLDIDVMWHSPAGQRSPGEASLLLQSADTVFTDLYGGGWQDVLPVMGHGPSTHRGALFGLHGETPLLPWDGPWIEEGKTDQVAVSISVRGVRYPYEVKKTLTVREDEPKLQIREELTNTSHQDLEFFWLQHPAYGEPFLSPGCRIDLPEGAEIYPLREINPNGRLAGDTTHWPLAKGRDGESFDLSIIPRRDIMAEETTFIKIRDSWYSLRNPKIDLGVVLRWNLSVHPWLWFWQNYNQPDYPWYGEAWNVAIEPSSSFPATTAEQLKAKSYLPIRGRESLVSELTFSFCKGGRPIRNVDRFGNAEL
jgi:hypothetical protein